MTEKMRRKIDQTTGSRVALVAVGEEAATADLARQFQVHPNQIPAWKKPLLENASQVIRRGHRRPPRWSGSARWTSCTPRPGS